MNCRLIPPGHRTGRLLLPVGRPQSRLDTPAEPWLLRLLGTECLLPLLLLACSGFRSFPSSPHGVRFQQLGYSKHWSPEKKARLPVPVEFVRVVDTLKELA